MTKKTLVLMLASLIVGFLAGTNLQSQSTQNAQESMSESPAFVAWDQFTQLMNQLGVRLLQDDAATTLSGGAFPVQTERDRADAVRQLAHMIVEGIRWQFDHADPDFPSLMVVNTDTTGWGGPNVDNKYLRATLYAEY